MSRDTVVYSFRYVIMVKINCGNNGYKGIIRKRKLICQCILMTLPRSYSKTKQLLPIGFINWANATWSLPMTKNLTNINDFKINMELWLFFPWDNLQTSACTIWKKQQHKTQVSEMIWQERSPQQIQPCLKIITMYSTIFCLVVYDGSQKYIGRKQVEPK